MSNVSPIVWVGGAAAVYFLFIKPGSTAPAVPIATNAMPAAGSVPVVTGYTATGQPIVDTAAAAAAAIPTTYGINVGAPGGAVVISNYDVLIAANPNLANPNYQLGSENNSAVGQANQYVDNYADLQQGIATWPGGITHANVQKHWTMYGCAEKRIFLPLVPPSTQNYTPPPAAPKTSSGIFKDILQAVTVVGVGGLEIASAGSLTSVLVPATSAALAAESKIQGVNATVMSDQVLGDAQQEILFTGAAILYNILPYYLSTNKKQVKGIYGQLDLLLKQYS